MLAFQKYVTNFINYTVNLQDKWTQSRLLIPHRAPEAIPLGPRSQSRASALYPGCPGPALDAPTWSSRSAIPIFQIEAPSPNHNQVRLLQPSGGHPLLERWPPLRFSSPRLGGIQTESRTPLLWMPVPTPTSPAGWRALPCGFRAPPLSLLSRILLLCSFVIPLQLDCLV